MCRYDVSTMLTLSLTKKYEGWWAAMLARKTALTLQDCLQGYTQEETLPVRSLSYCTLSALHQVGSQEYYPQGNRLTRRCACYASTLCMPEPCPQ